VLSANDVETDRVRKLERGADDVVAKPTASFVDVALLHSSKRVRGHHDPGGDAHGRQRPADATVVLARPTQHWDSA
jgi:DNA-binding response OmpR family regulator